MEGTTEPVLLTLASLRQMLAQWPRMDQATMVFSHATRDSQQYQLVR